MPTDVLSLKALGFGALCWLLPFLGALPVVPLKEKRPLVFKTVMGVVLAASTAGLCRFWFAEAPHPSALGGLLLGALWMLVCIAIDLPLFIKGFKMKPRAYLTEIGVAYLVVPLITWQNASLLGAGS